MGLKERSRLRDPEGQGDAAGAAVEAASGSQEMQLRSLMKVAPQPSRGRDFHSWRGEVSAWLHSTGRLSR